MRIYWTVFTTARKEKNASHVLGWFLRELQREAINISLSPYPKTGGYKITLETPSAGENWADHVVETIELGQRVARSWILNGDILTDPSGWSNKPCVTGVTSVQWQISRNPNHPD